MAVAVDVLQVLPTPPVPAASYVGISWQSWSNPLKAWDYDGAGSFLGERATLASPYVPLSLGVTKGRDIARFSWYDHASNTLVWFEGTEADGGPPASGHIHVWDLAAGTYHSHPTLGACDRAFPMVIGSTLVWVEADSTSVFRCASVPLAGGSPTQTQELSGTTFAVTGPLRFRDAAVGVEADGATFGQTNTVYVLPWDGSAPSTGTGARLAGSSHGGLPPLVDGIHTFGLGESFFVSDGLSKEIIRTYQTSGDGLIFGGLQPLWADAENDGDPLSFRTWKSAHRNLLGNRIAVYPSTTDKLVWKNPADSPESGSWVSSANVVQIEAGPDGVPDFVLPLNLDPFE